MDLWNSDNFRLLDVAHEHARGYLQKLPARSVRATENIEDLLDSLGRELPETGELPETVLDRLAGAADAGAAATSGGRYFGFVNGGTLPVAVAADWMTSAWDQHGGSYYCSPINAAAEVVVAAWLLQLLDLPAEASVGFTSGATMANLVGLAAARNTLLARQGWDVRERGLRGSPAVRILVPEHAHPSVSQSLRILGYGERDIVLIDTDAAGMMRLAALRSALDTDKPAVVVAQAGHVNTGAFDAFAEIGSMKRERQFWLHIDGAFGLWARASRKYAKLAQGAQHADSWAVDAHKTLNTPYDCGFAIVANAEAHRSAIAPDGFYAVRQEPSHRMPLEFTPELSRRARALPVYAALRALGRTGTEQLVEQLCERAMELRAKVLSIEGAWAPGPACFNQGVVAFSRHAGTDLASDITSEVIARVQAGGECWVHGAPWKGRTVMRLSVSSAMTTKADIDRSVAAIARATRECRSV